MMGPDLKSFADELLKKLDEQMKNDASLSDGIGTETVTANGREVPPGEAYFRGSRDAYWAVSRYIRNQSPEVGKS